MSSSSLPLPSSTSSSSKSSSSSSKKSSAKPAAKKLKVDCSLAGILRQIQLDLKKEAKSHVAIVGKTKYEKIYLADLKKSPTAQKILRRYLKMKNFLFGDTAAEYEDHLYLAASKTLPASSDGRPGLSVYSDKIITAQKNKDNSLVQYSGVSFSEDEDEQHASSLYIYNFPDFCKNVSPIDAKEQGDPCARSINHAYGENNMVPKYKKVDGKWRVYLSVKENSIIYPHSELLLSYGMPYWRTIGISPLVTNSVNNAVTEEDRYLCAREQKSYQQTSKVDENKNYQALGYEDKSTLALPNSDTHFNDPIITLSETGEWDATLQQPLVTPLMLACYEGKIETIEQLISKKASVNRLSAVGHSALEYVIKGCHDGLVSEEDAIKIINCLKNAGMEVITYDKNHKPTSHFVIDHTQGKTALKRFYFSLLTKDKLLGDLDVAADSQGFLPIAYAISKGYVEDIEILFNVLTVSEKTTLLKTFIALQTNQQTTMLESALKAAPGDKMKEIVKILADNLKSHKDWDKVCEKISSVSATCAEIVANLPSRSSSSSSSSSSVSSSSSASIFSSSSSSSISTSSDLPSQSSSSSSSVSSKFSSSSSSLSNAHSYSTRSSSTLFFNGSKKKRKRQVSSRSNNGNYVTGSNKP